MENQLELPVSEKKEVRRPWRRQIVIACAVLLVAVALALNFTLFGGNIGTTNDNVNPDNGAGDNVGGDSGANVTLDGYFSVIEAQLQKNMLMIVLLM